MSKLETLASDFGYADVMDMLEESVWDSIVPGICTNPGCDYTTDVEPDQSRGWCENCNTNTVASCLSIQGII